MSAAVKAPEADAELLAAAADFHKLTAEDVAFWNSVEQDLDNKHWDACNAEGGLWTRLYAATDRVIELSAMTLDGMRAKASVVKALIIEQNGPEERGHWNEDTHAAMSLIRDLVGDPA
jgi:hypothetical protein